MNFKGDEILYATLKPGNSIKINTYVGHPFIFRDKKTNARLLANQKEVLHPVESSSSAEEWKHIAITIPGRNHFTFHFIEYHYGELCEKHFNQCFAKAHS